MEFFRLAFIALTVFGAGATAVDLFCVLKHANRGHDGHGIHNGILRASGYFSLGAGPVGWIALARGEGLVESILWAAISGLLIAVLARVWKRGRGRDPA